MAQGETASELGRRGWGKNKVDGVTIRTWTAIGVAIAAVVLGFGAWWTYSLDRTSSMGAGSMRDGMAMGSGDAPAVPAVHGYYEGEHIFFIHTEASDREVAELLTDMMGSRVPVVPELTSVPAHAVADVYVFTNGVRPADARGPMGFQADVFASAPGDKDYSPLRSIHLVTWRDGADPRLLQSARDVEIALEQREILIEEPGVVVNMPFLSWPGGER